MVVAIPVTEDHGMESRVDPRFGRAAGFILYSKESGDLSYLANTQNYEAAQGAGIQTAQNLIGAKVTTVISGLCGPKAYAVLSRGGVELYYRKGGTVQDALEELEKGRLQPAADANIEGHWV